MMSEDQRAAVHAAFATRALGGELEREELQALLTKECEVLYDGIVIIKSDAEANDNFLKLAAAATLDLAPIKDMTVAAREAFAFDMLADFDPAYANGAIIAYHYAARTELFAAMTFAGYQVRLDSGASLANYAGVRAVFDINEAAIAAILAKPENEGKSVVLTVGATGAVSESYTIAYKMVDGVLTPDAENTTAEIYERGEGKSVNIMVTHKGENITAEKLKLEYSFNYTIALGDATTAFAVNSATFGDSVSSAVVYGHFYNNGFANDRFVKQIYDLCAE